MGSGLISLDIKGLPWVGTFSSRKGNLSPARKVFKNIIIKYINNPHILMASLIRSGSRVHAGFQGHGGIFLTIAPGLSQFETSWAASHLLSIPTSGVMRTNENGKGQQRIYQFCQAGTGTLYGREMKDLRCEALSPTCSFHSSFSLWYHLRKKSLMKSCGLDHLHPGIGFPGGSVLKNPSANAGDAGSIHGSRRSPGGGNSNPLQYSCLGNPIDSGALRATVLRIAKNQT